MVVHSAEDNEELPFPGTGEMGNLIRTFDWTRTPLGPIPEWPQSLKTVTGTLLLSPVPIVLIWGEDGIMIYNDAYSVFAGERHPQLLGAKVREGWEEVADFNDNVMKICLAGGVLSYRNQKLLLNRRGKLEPVWMNLDYSPVLDETGEPAGVIAVVVETTESVLAQRKLRESEERFRALITATSDVIYRMSPDWKEMRQLEGRGFLADTGSPILGWQELYLFPEDRQHIEAVIGEAIRTKNVFQLEHRVRRTDGSAGWTFSRAVPIFDERGKIIEWFGAASDVTERKRYEEHLKLVVQEFNHRVKNNLAMTQAIAMQSFRNASDLREAQTRFSARMVALGQANDLLTGERWAGASLRGAVELGIRPHRPDDVQRCTVEGEDITLPAKTALTMTLAMHEMAANARRYGAWSNSSGKVSVSWSRYQDEEGVTRLRIVWRETGGPPVRAPTEHGFGTILVERGLPREMGGEARMEFPPDGFICTIDAPENLNAGQ